MSWFEKNGWYYDHRDHCWKRNRGEKDEILPKHDPLFNRIMHGSKEGTFPSVDSKPRYDPPIFYRVNNILIFNNEQYPLKLSEVKP